MPDILGQVLATPGLIWLLATISVAGIIRGFTGFGTALIFVPVAGIFLMPAQVIALMTLTGVFSTTALLPRAWGLAHKREVSILAIAALITVPLGLWLLGLVEREVIRWLVAAIAGVTLASLIAGWRFARHVAPLGLLVIGGAAGLIGGLTGLTGPIVIMFYLAGHSAAASVRANTILFLAILDVVLIANLALSGHLGLEIIGLAAILGVPYFITSLIGQALFDPTYEQAYRWATYVVITLALISGLPIWN